MIDLGYRPRDAFAAFHRRKQRWACLVCHRRAGKTVACIADLVDAALRCTRTNGRYAYLAPYYTQAKDVAWVYLKGMVAPIPGATINESELRADLPNGARVRLYGADNADRLRGLFLDGLVLDEYADMRPSVWGEVLRPALSDRRGWAVFIGTPKGHNEFYDKWREAQAEPGEWFSLMLRASQSGFLPQDELDDARKRMTPEQYEQEYECSFEAAILGAYYGKEIAQAEREGRIRDVPWEPELPVYTAWDLGIGDSTAIWVWQQAGAETRVIRAYENHGQALPHYAAVLASFPYRYAQDYLPHDARVRELGTGRTRVETLQQLNRKPALVPAHKVMDGINAGRLLLSSPTTFIDRVNCADGLEAMRQYRAEFDEKARDFKDTPRHDWTSHYADGWRYLSMAQREMAPAAKPKEPERRLNVGFAGGVTFDDLISNRPRGEERV